MGFGAVSPSRRLSHPNMQRFKKSKKPRQPSQEPAAFGIPIHIAIGPVGFGATLDLEDSPEGVLRSIGT